MKRVLLKSIFHLGGFSSFHRLKRDELLILTYHRFSSEKHPFRVSGPDFRAHLRYLERHCHVVSLAEALEGISSRSELPPNATVITIDDGYNDAYEVAGPILSEFAFPATLFAATGFLDGECWLWTDKMRYCFLNTKHRYVRQDAKSEVPLNGHEQRCMFADRANASLKGLPTEEREIRIAEMAADLEVEVPALPTSEYAPLTWEQAKEMEAGGVNIESHTVSHPILATLDEEQADFEIRTSKDRLESVLSKKVRHFCYPNGSYTPAVERSVKNAGYESAVTTEYGFNPVASEAFRLRRIGAPTPIENFAQVVSGFELLRTRVNRYGRKSRV